MKQDFSPGRSRVDGCAIRDVINDFASLSLSPFQVCGLEVLLSLGSSSGRTSLTSAAASSPLGLAAVDADEDEEEKCQDGPHDHGDKGLLGHVV